MIFLLSILAPCTLVAICQPEFITRIYIYISLSLVHCLFHHIALHCISFLVLYCFVVQCCIVCLAVWCLATSSIKLNLNLRTTWLQRGWGKGRQAWRCQVWCEKLCPPLRRCTVWEQTEKVKWSAMKKIQLLEQNECVVVRRFTRWQCSH